MFTYFSFWEKEIQEWLSSAAEAINIPAEQLKQWMHHEAILASKNAQAQYFAQLKQTLIPPFVITPQHMLEQHMHGFNAIKKAMRNQFSNEKLEQSFTKLVPNLLEHTEIFAIQADITTKLLALNLVPTQIADWLAKQFTNHSLNLALKEGVAERIANHLVLLQEYVSQCPRNVTPIVRDPRLFGKPDSALVTVAPSATQQAQP